LEDVRNGMDQALLARCPHHGEYCRERTRLPLRALVAQRLSDRLRNRGGGFATEALRVRIRHLPGHVERGAERFTVEWHRAGDSVFYEVFAFARQAHPLARVGPPFVQLVQRRFAAASLRAMAAAHHNTFQFPRGCRTPFRISLQFSVIAVMSVKSGAFPDTYGVFDMTLNCQCIWGPSLHRHGERHRRNALPKRLPRRRDGDDAHDADIRAYSK
jgi:hypothetical protein